MGNINPLIDCFIVGHYQFDMQLQRKLLKLNFGGDSHAYREVNTSSLGFVTYGKKVYAPSQIYEVLYKGAQQPSSMVENTFSLAVAYLGTYLSKRNFAIDYINSFEREKEYLAEKLQNGSVRCIVIPTTFYLLPYPIIEIVQYIRKYSSSVKIIVGGPYIQSNARSIDGEELQKLFQSIGADIYVYSMEGEYALSKTLEALQKGSSLSDIDNIYYKDGSKYVYTKYSQELNNPDENSVNWDMFKDRMCEFVNVRASVSCPFACAFCGYPLMAGKYRSMGIEVFERELDMLNNNEKVKGVFFIDDTFNFPMDRFKETLRMMAKKKYKFKWISHLRGQNVDREAVELMKESGCIQVLIGTESGSQKILDNMNKRVTVEEYHKTFSLLNEYGIMSTASLIIGYPGETYDTYMETVNFIKEAKPTFFRTHMWYYQNGVPVDKNKVMYGLEGSGYSWTHNTMDSETAHRLSDELFMNMEDSVYDAECSFPFQLICRGYDTKKAIEYMRIFSDCVKNSLSNNDNKSISDDMARKLANALK